MSRLYLLALSHARYIRTTQPLGALHVYVVMEFPLCAPN
jgi:hypothetical protein